MGDETDVVSYSEVPSRAMSARSSSGSWLAGPGPDIIDLDRYMRGGVRPHNRRRPSDSECDRLVVDAGGPTVGGPGGVGALGGGPSPRPKSSSTTSAPRKPRDKRYSHDSGLSDGSYVKRRPHRRVTGENATTIRAHRERERERGARTGNPSNSMRNFRAACERALKDQQEQIARVAQLCERLTEQTERGRTAAPRQTSVTCTQDSSDISSSSTSRSTRGKSRKDKHRPDECKTYKIIMNKLDELNRLFAARARLAPPSKRPLAPPGPPLPPPGRARGAPSDGSVSVSDKLVSTEPQERQHTRPMRSVAAYTALNEVRSVLVSPRTPQSAAHSSTQRRSPPQLVERGVGGEGVEPRAAPAAGTRSGRLNVATESLVECDTDVTGSLQHCKFDRDYPLHLHTQARRLHKQRARAHSVDYSDTRRTNGKTKDHTHYVSLCGRCQGYWRTLTTMTAQLFNRIERDPNDDG